jgi:hypothetical protein
MGTHMAAKEVCLSAHEALVAKSKEQILKSVAQVAGTGVEVAVATVLVRVPRIAPLSVCCEPMCPRVSMCNLPTVLHTFNPHGIGMRLPKSGH